MEPLPGNTLTMPAGFLSSSGAADFGWTGYAPLAEITRTPGVGADLWVVAVLLTGLSGVLTGVNIIATVLSLLFLLVVPAMLFNLRRFRQENR